MSFYKLRDFSSYLKRHASRRLSCVRCNKEPSSPMKMQDHLMKDHLISDTSYPWCLGNYSWPRFHKNQHVTHLRYCYDKYELRHDTDPSKRILEEFNFKIKWNRVKCPRCETILLSGDLESHVQNVHGCVPKGCLWCDGQYPYKDLHHQVSCFQQKQQNVSPMSLHIDIVACVNGLWIEGKFHPREISLKSLDGAPNDIVNIFIKLPEDLEYYKDEPKEEHNLILPLRISDENCIELGNLRNRLKYTYEEELGWLVGYLVLWHEVQNADKSAKQDVMAITLM